jgi:hypothetical protein
MANPYPVEIADADSGVVRVAGAATFTDPSNQPGGSTLPIQTGEGSPVATVTPTAAGYLYIDTTNGTIYQASGATNLDWIGVGNVAGNIGEATGLLLFGRSVYVLAGERDAPATSVYVGSAYNQWNGHGQGLQLEFGASEGLEQFTVRAGSTGQYIAQLLNGSGDSSFPGKVVVEGPLVVALVDNTGLEVTAGQAAIWFDDNDSAPALQIYAKTANGTVVTGHVTLA